MTFDTATENERAVVLMTEGGGSGKGRGPQPPASGERDDRGSEPAGPARRKDESARDRLEDLLSGGGSDPQGDGPKRPRVNWVYLAVAVALIAYIIFNMGGVFGGKSNVTELATSEFVTAVKEDRVQSATFTTANGAVEGKYWTSKSAAKEKSLSKLKSYKTSYVGSDSLSELMADHPRVVYKVNTVDPDFWTNVIVTVLPTIAIIAVMVYFMRQTLGSNSRAMQFGKTNAKTSEATRPKVKFKDVAGIDEAVEELEEVRDFLADPDRYRKLGAKIPRGVLLVGPPGTGKTLLAKAVAGEAGVPFFSISGSDFVEMFVGVGASRVRDLFKEAKAQAPSIIFIDEIDAVGRQRGAGLGGGHDEREQTLNQLLVEMDGFEDNESVILIAATNRPDILDPALLRPGRFDRQVTVDRPDVKGREQILRVHAENKPFKDDVRFDKLAKLTVGFTGADLANLLNEAALLTARRHHSFISMEEVEESMERVIAGPKKKGRVMTERERTTIAYHESGHALVGHVLDNSDPVHKISIISRGQALGYTLQLPTEDHYLKTKNEMLDELAVFLGGRVAEELMCDDVTSGASNDLERATKMAREMVTRLGMSEVLGTQVFGEAQHQVFLGRDYADHQDYSEKTAERIDEEVQRIMREAHARAEKILSERHDQLDLMAKVLLERETVEGEAVEALLDNEWDAYLEREAAKGGDDGSEAPADKKRPLTPEQEEALQDEAAAYAAEQVSGMAAASSVGNSADDES
ncbi:ATP-dependent zinc metalloprotease FtsH [Collinsella sp. AK_207A]|uniref:ATP-dependent zinc metalloprotease FtsH n=1 Tax=Collinsella sp. AK_207A TaxID=2650472 RepID=UPI00127C69AD|nr:ATP-dependent zinc metalloprotease FtsH [Collinsella sp. AK_207A]VWL92705.1 ATP-dependent zinc metalloprotease FtsH [Collinsella sp. AK_207A]